MLVIFFSCRYSLFLQVERFLCIPNLLSFILNGCRVLSNAFYAFIAMIMWFFFIFSFLMWCVTLILNVEPALHNWNKSNFITVHNSLHCWIKFANIVEDFRTWVHSNPLFCHFLLNHLKDLCNRLLLQQPPITVCEIKGLSSSLPALTADLARTGQLYSLKAFLYLGFLRISCSPSSHLCCPSSSLWPWTSSLPPPGSWN